MVATIVRFYSYVFHFFLALFLLGISGVVLASGNHNLRLGMLPWTGAELTNWVFWGSLIGLVSVVLAATGLFRFLFPVWALLVLVLMVKGYFGGPYTFGGANHFYQTLAMIVGALIAFLGSLTVFRASRARRI